MRVWCFSCGDGDYFCVSYGEDCDYDGSEDGIYFVGKEVIVCVEVVEIYVMVW